jgi:hypothetical protein
MAAELSYKLLASECRSGVGIDMRNAFIRPPQMVTIGPLFATPTLAGYLLIARGLRAFLFVVCKR